MTRKRSTWLGETLRIDLRCSSFKSGDYYVTIPFVRDWMLQASDDEVIKKLLKPALRALRRDMKLTKRRKS